MRILLIGAVTALTATAALADPADELMAVDKAFSDRAQEIPVGEAFAEYAAPGAFLLHESAWEPITGAEAMREAYSGLPDAASLIWEPQNARVSEDGTLGYTWGRWMLSGPDADGAKQTAHGKYMSVWEKQPGGSWKFIADGGHRTAAPAPDGYELN